MSVPETTVPQPAAEPRSLAKELGLTDDEYERLVGILAREPSTAELGTFSVMWSEHCSYKSSKVHLRRLPTEGESILVGPGENAGVVDVGGGLAVTFKIESHNHPSFVEPFQGATTGVGGIIRDILTMGARPIALLDPLRFGDPTDPRMRWIIDGVVRGVGHYGNSLGVATVGGETVFDPSYQGNPLVNVLCVGVLPAEAIQLARAENVGDIAVLIGQRTGRDGIGGASVLASAEFSNAEVDEAKRPNVQVGDPFAGKLLIESCLELYRRALLRGIQDMGAAGIACSTSEMAANARLGMRVNLDKVPLREPTMESWEILCSESQERMLALVAPDDVAEVLAVCERWGIDATPIGEVTDGDRLVCTRGGEVVHDAPASALVDEGPVYTRPVAPWNHPRADEDVDSWDPPADLEAATLEVLTSLGVAPATWVHQQYDAIVGSGTVAGPGGDAAVLRLPDPAVVRGEVFAQAPAEPARGVAIATDGNGRWCALDPAEGARRVAAEAARNVACTGARPIAATNCLNFGSPERADVMGSFSDTIDGLAEACLALGVPITGGNVSFYNSTQDKPIHPTPVLGVLGVIDDVARAVGHQFRREGDVIVSLGAPIVPGLAGSEYLWARHRVVAGHLGRIDLDLEARLQRLLPTVATQGLLRSAHDVATGGLVTTLVESASGGFGAHVTPATDLPPHQWLFSESPSRVVVSVDPGEVDRLHDQCVEGGVGWDVLGRVTGARRLTIDGAVDLDLDAVDSLRAQVIPTALGEDEF